MQSPHDHLFHRVFAEPLHAAGLIRTAVPEPLDQVIDWSSLTECSAALFDRDLNLHHADVLYTARDRQGDEVLFVVDHKSESRRFALLQLHRYVQHIWDKWLGAGPARTHLPPVVPIVLHHDQSPWRAPTSLRELWRDGGDLGLPRPAFDVLLLDLARHSAPAIAAFRMPPIARLCLLHLKFARGAPPDRLEQSLRRWQPWFAAVAAGPGGRDELAVFHAYTLEVAEMPAVRLATLMARLLGPTAGDLVMSTADKLRAEGRLQGQAEGKAEGKAEGEVLGRAAVLLRQLGKRFGPLAVDIEARIRSATANDLDRWADRLLDATSIGEVFAHE